MTLISKTPALILAASVLVAGCAENYQVGSEVDNGNFGRSTMMNHLSHTSGAASYTVSLNQRFNAEVPATVTFPFNSAALSNSARAALRQQADFMRQFPEVRFRVYGHTDLVGSDSYNRRLGLRRAEAVVRYLGTQGIGRNRLEAVVSHGETKPLIATGGRERRNRRTVTEVTGFVSSHQSVMDGRYAQIIYRDYVSGARAGTRLSGDSGITGIGSDGG